MTNRALIAVAIVAVVSVAAFASSRVEAQLPDCVSGGAVPAGNAGLVKDCETLLNLMDDLRGSASLNWSETTPIGSWTGVRLGGSPQRVTIVKLQKGGLNGSIPAEIGSLDKLVDLWLYINELSGPLPAELGNLSDLETLMLANNNLSGQIPEALNDLTLNRLWLKGNNFTGCVPYNLTLVPDNDLSRVSLPACAPPSDGTPGPTPPPGATPTPVPTATPTPPTEPPTSLSDMVKRVRPAVVKISNESDYFGFAAGTGFIFRTDAEDRSADILTNYHVVHELMDPLVKVNDIDLVQTRSPERSTRAATSPCSASAATTSQPSSHRFRHALRRRRGHSHRPSLRPPHAQEGHSSRRSNDHQGHNLSLSIQHRDGCPARADRHSNQPREQRRPTLRTQRPGGRHQFIHARTYTATLTIGLRTTSISPSLRPLSRTSSGSGSQALRTSSGPSAAS